MSSSTATAPRRRFQEPSSFQRIAAGACMPSPRATALPPAASGPPATERSKRVSKRMPSSSPNGQLGGASAGAIDDRNAIDPSSTTTCASAVAGTRIRSWFRVTRRQPSAESRSSVPRSRPPSQTSTETGGFSPASGFF